MITENIGQIRVRLIDLRKKKWIPWNCLHIEKIKFMENKDIGKVVIWTVAVI